MFRFGFVFFVVSLASLQVKSTDLNRIYQAAVDVRKAHILRYYERCLRKYRTAEQCRSEVKSLHPRELAANATIMKFSYKYNKDKLAKSFNYCYDPSNDYLSLIECHERLARIVEADQALPEIPKKKTASERRDELYKSILEKDNFTRTC